MAPRVRLIQRAGIGYESIDVEAVAQAGIPAAYTPGANSIAVAEYGRHQPTGPQGHYPKIH